MTSDRDFAEKRFNRPGAFLPAAIYTFAVVAVAGVAFAFYAFGARDSVYAASLVPAFLFIGGVGAFVRTYRGWKADSDWVAWQGAGWFLLLLMLVALAIPGSAFMVGGVE
jgi:predicted membrane-bound mannosyltransferase